MVFIGRTNNGEKPTGNLTRATKASGCSSVHEFLNKGSYVVAAPQNLVTPLKVNGSSSILTLKSIFSSFNHLTSYL